MYPFVIKQTIISIILSRLLKGDGRPQPQPHQTLAAALLPQRRRHAAGAEPPSLSALTSTPTTSALDPVEP